MLSQIFKRGTDEVIAVAFVGFESTMHENVDSPALERKAVRQLTIQISDARLTLERKAALGSAHDYRE